VSGPELFVGIKWRRIPPCRSQFARPFFFVEGGLIDEAI
jgi:hypothetical protein